MKRKIRFDNRRIEMKIEKLRNKNLKMLKFTGCQSYLHTLSLLNSGCINMNSKMYFVMAIYVLVSI